MVERNAPDTYTPTAMEQGRISVPEPARPTKATLDAATAPTPVHQPTSAISLPVREIPTAADSPLRAGDIASVIVTPVASSLPEEASSPSHLVVSSALANEAGERVTLEDTRGKGTTSPSPATSDALTQLSQRREERVVVQGDDISKPPLETGGSGNKGGNKDTPPPTGGEGPREPAGDKPDHSENNGGDMPKRDDQETGRESGKVPKDTDLTAEGTSRGDFPAPEPIHPVVSLGKEHGQITPKDGNPAIKKGKEIIDKTMIQSRISSATSPDEINKILDNAIAVVREETKGKSVVEFYRELINILPGRISSDKQRLLLDEIKNHGIDEKKGKNAFILLNLKTILTEIQPYFSADEVRNEDILQTAIEHVSRHIYSFTSQNVPLQIRDLFKVKEIKATLLDLAYVPKDLLFYQGIGELIQMIDDTIAQRRSVVNDLLDPEQIEALVRQLEEKTGYPQETLREMIISRDTRVPHKEDATVYEAAMDDFTQEAVLYSKLGELTDREQLVIALRFGIGTNDGQPKTLNEVGQKLGVTREVVKTIESRALRKLGKYDRY